MHLHWLTRTALAMATLLPAACSVKAADVSSPETVKRLLEKRGSPILIPGELIVKRKIRVLGRGTPEKLGLEAVRSTSGGETIYRFSAPTLGLADIAERTMAALKEMRRDPTIEYAQPKYLLQIAADRPAPDLRRQWSYRAHGTGAGKSEGGADVQHAWDFTHGSPQVVVAVIDTGLVTDHSGIQSSANLLSGYDMIHDPKRAKDGDGRDADPTDPGDAVSANECGLGSPALPSSWHGSHVAGIVGVGKAGDVAGIWGIDWQVGVLPVRVLGRCGGDPEDINDAIRWAAGLAVPNVPRNSHPAKVINLSLGASVPCTESPSTQHAINEAIAAGSLIVAAAGNDAIDVSGTYPAGCEGVLAVAASDARGRLVTRYSNYGGAVSILAPGGDVDRDDDGDGARDGILSFVRAGLDSYNGTSMAAPHVSGVAALLLARSPSLTPAAIRERLMKTSVPRSDTECPLPCGAGLLNAGAALGGPP